MKRLTLLLLSAALFSATAIAQAQPQIAVYVTGNVSSDVKKALGTKMLSELVNSGRYIGIERSNDFLAKIDEEQVTQRSGAIDNKQISQVGKQFGVKYVCIADITPALGAFQISARIVDVETAQVSFISESNSELRTLDDLTSVSVRVVKKMFGGGAEEQKPEYVAPPPLPPPPPQQPPQYTQEANYQQQAPVVYYQEPVRKAPKKRKVDYYVAPHYLWMSDIPTGGDVEVGLIWGNGAFFGIDFGIGFSKYQHKLFDEETNKFSETEVEDNKHNCAWLGGGFSLGNALNLPGQLQFLYGGTLGVWLVNYGDRYKVVGASRDGAIIVSEGLTNLDFLAPFVKLRWRYVELSYRCLLGVSKKDVGFKTAAPEAFASAYKKKSSDSEFTADHQLTLGLHFATSKRDR